MMITRLRLFLIIVLVASGISANAKNLKSTLNNLTESLERLSAIKKSEVLPLEEKREIQLEASKTAFNRVIDLALEELNNLKKRLEKYSGPKEQLKLVGQFIDFHQKVRNQINQDIAWEEVRAIAQEFKKWREEFYIEKVTLIVNAVTALQNQEIIKTAENRLAKVNKDIKLIKNYLRPTKWNEAEKLIVNAKNAIEEAGEINITVQKLLQEMELKEIDNLLEESIQKITEAYQNFIALGKLVKG